MRPAPQSPAPWRGPESAPIRPYAGLLLALAALGAWPSAASPPVPHWSERVVFTVTIRPMTVDASAGPSALTLRVDPDMGARGALELGWPTRATVARVELRALDRSSPLGEAPRADVEAILRRADGSERYASRRIVGERGTALFEVDREGDRNLVLALEWESELEPVVRGLPSVGAPVRFSLEIERALGGRVYPLESNQLNSFIGETVGYAFKLGQGVDTEALRVRLTPIFIEGDVLTVDIEIEGRLPAESGPRPIKQRRRTLLSSGAASIVPVGSAPTADESLPDGYRFRIRALF